jgi:ribosomal protein S15P/S13E
MATDTPETQQVSIQDACRLLRLSRRTVQRRLADGTLTGRKEAGKWVVDVPLTRPEGSQEQDRSAIDVLTAQVGTLTAQLAQLTQQNEQLTGHIDTLEKDKEFLQSALAAALTIQKQIASTVEIGRRPWYKFWGGSTS